VPYIIECLTITRSLIVCSHQPGHKRDKKKTLISDFVRTMCFIWYAAQIQKIGQSKQFKDLCGQEK